jgi:hypothetical protein
MPLKRRCLTLFSLISFISAKEEQQRINWFYQRGIKLTGDKAQLQSWRGPEG